MCFYKGLNSWIQINHQIKSTLNSRKSEKRQISYTLNIIHLEYIPSSPSLLYKVPRFGRSFGWHYETRLNATGVYVEFILAAKLRLMDLLFFICSWKQSCDIEYTSPCRCPANVGAERCKYKYGN